MHPASPPVGCGPKARRVPFLPCAHCTRRTCRDFWRAGSTVVHGTLGGCGGSRSLECRVVQQPCRRPFLPGLVCVVGQKDGSCSQGVVFGPDTLTCHPCFPDPVGTGYPVLSETWSYPRGHARSTPYSRRHGRPRGCGCHPPPSRLFGRRAGRFGRAPRLSRPESGESVKTGGPERKGRGVQKPRGRSRSTGRLDGSGPLACPYPFPYTLDSRSTDGGKRS